MPNSYNCITIEEGILPNKLCLCLYPFSFSVLLYFFNEESKFNEISYKCKAIYNDLSELIRGKSISTM